MLKLEFSVVKSNLRNVIRGINTALLTTIGACGDVNRNVMCSSMPTRSKLHAEVYEASKAISTHLLPSTSAYHEVIVESTFMLTFADLVARRRREKESGSWRCCPRFRTSLWSYISSQKVRYCFLLANVSIGSRSLSRYLRSTTPMFMLMTSGLLRFKTVKRRAWLASMF